MTLTLIPSPPERRRTPRIEVTLPIEALDGGPNLMAHDLGTGGMLVTTARPRWPGQHVSVRFQIPGEKRAIRATCRVVELVEVPHGIGLSLKFLELAPNAELQLVRFVSQKLRDERSPAS
jgi:c-di-GMP-binding flagellar brake protein YcgR